MNILKSIGNVLGVRHDDGSYFYTRIGNQKSELDGYNSYTVALANPISLGLIDKIANYLAQANIYIENDENRNSPLIQLIDNPNEFQSKEDFFKEFVFNYISCGYQFIAPIGAVGFERDVKRVDSLYNLNPMFIDYGNANIQTKLLTRQEVQESNNLKFRYQIQQGKDGQSSSYKTFDYKDVIGFFDIANGLDNDFLLSSPSRLDSVLQPCVNIIKAFEAQNIVIKSNGREMFFSEAKGSELGLHKNLDKGDVKEIQRASSKYGMEHGQYRSMFLNKETGWKSLHINAKDLATEETIKTASIAIATALNVPKELIPVFDNSAYNNRKEALIDLIQGTVEPILADICSTLTSQFGYEKTPLKYSVDHLAPMQHIEQVKTDKALKLSQAFRNFTQSGMTPEQANEVFEGLGIQLNEDEG